MSSQGRRTSIMEGKTLASRPFPKRHSGIRQGETANREKEVTKGSLPRRKTLIHDPSANHEKSSVPSVLSAARDWFKNLSGEERAFATGFTDEPFLRAFFGVASPWSSDTQGRSGIDWGKMVSVDEFRSNLAAFSSSMKNTPKVANKKTSAGPSVNKKGGESAVKDADMSSKKPGQIIDSDAYIIPSHKVSDETYESLKRLFDNIAVIFPSAFNKISNGDERHPHIIIRAKYFDEVDDTELFSFMDLLSKKPFLTFDNFEGKSEPMDWLRLISDEKYVPMYSLVLARIEWGIRDAYLLDLGRRSGQPLSAASGQMLSLVSDLFSHCQSFADVTTSTNTVSRFLAPLLDACSVKRNAGKILTGLKTESALLTPLPLLVRGCDQGPVDLQALDKAVGKCVDGLDAHLKSIPEINAAEFELEIEKEAAAMQGKDGNVPPSGRKKKKQKKKKGKKKSADAGDKSVTTEDGKLSAPVVGAGPHLSNDVVVVAAQAKNSSEDILNPKDSSADEVHDVSSCDSDEDLVGVFAGVSSFTTRKAEPATAPKQGKLAVVAPTMTPIESRALAEQLSDEIEDHVDDGDAWETVEIRPRGIRKKSVEHISQETARQASFFPSGEVHGNKKSRSSRHRPKKAARKLVREILFSVIDSVEEEAKKPKPRLPSPPRAMNSWKNGPPGSTPRNGSAPRGFAAAVALGSHFPSPLSAKEPPKIQTMRDIVVGSRSIPQLSSSQNDRPLSPLKRKNQTGTVADQNTAPTYQETVSAVSTSSNTRLGSKTSPSTVADRKSDTSSGDSDEAPQYSDRAVSSKADSALNSTPPLPTLLSPENAYSATSSVASSLDAPHAGQAHHRSVAVFDTNDVGCHLLDVCDHLSQDMSLFMSRRALALSIRRRERGALLAALQDTISSIWPGRCHAELYGSCATQLDLPASDIDVVILGLDRNVVGPVKQQSGERSKPSRSHSLQDTGSKDEGNENRQRATHRVPSITFPTSPTQSNAERVVILAAKLEKKPWAVQVRAIPTATVPVIKILADPSRLVGNSAGGDWMAQHQHMAAQAAAAAGKKSDGFESKGAEVSDPESYSKSTLLPWRGSDVMKGLLSLDITFEGFEHGGLGSTQFSSRVVKEACAESGLHPDQTAFVQVLMVVKELLAQRKLNEPYSGGLSSYASLLLVLALVQERAVIRAEIDRVEQQKRAMAAAELGSVGGSNGTFARTTPSSSRNQLFASAASAGQTQAPEKASPKPSPSSWANVAKKPSKSASKDSRAADSVKEKPSYAPAKKPSFADAVARSSPAVSKASVTPKRGDMVQRKALGGGSELGSGAQKTAASTKNSPETESVEAIPQHTTSDKPTISATPQFYPQGYNDIVEVLCSGKTTAGKHERPFYNQVPPFSYLSPYVPRRAPGTIDPVTGMLTVDPIVVYDPLEGAENSNVARRCFAWNSVRWIFGQSYNTLASAVERSATPPTTPGGSPSHTVPSSYGRVIDGALYSPDGDMTDTSSSLLRCLLSF